MKYQLWTKGNKNLFLKEKVNFLSFLSSHPLNFLSLFSDPSLLSVSLGLVFMDLARDSRVKAKELNLVPNG